MFHIYPVCNASIAAMLVTLKELGMHACYYARHSYLYHQTHYSDEDLTKYLVT